MKVEQVRCTEQNEGLHKEEKMDKQEVFDIVDLDNLEEMNMHIKLIERARRYRGEKDYSMSLHCLEEAIDIMKTEDAYNEMAEVYIKKQEIKKAIDILDSTIGMTDKESSKNKNTQKIVELILLKENQKIRYQMKSLEKINNSFEVYIELGRMKAKMGQPEEGD